MKFFEFFVDFLNISNCSGCSRIAVRFGIFGTQIEDGLEPLSFLVQKKIIALSVTCELK